MKTQNSLPFYIGLNLLLIPFISLLLTTIYWFCHSTINATIFPLACLIAFILFYLFRNNLSLTIKKIVSLSLISLLLILLFVFISYIIYDYSYDGLGYHQNIIYSFLQGWNPIYKSNSVFAFPSNELWVNHYAKGLETMAAVIAATFNNLECGKTINFMLISSSCFFAYDFIHDYLHNISIKKRVLISLLLSIAPIIVCQFFTFYIDWALYTLLLILGITLYRLEHTKKSFIEYFILTIIVAYAFSIKFNIAFWICFVLLIYSVWLLLSKKYNIIKNGTIFVLIGLFIGVLCFSFNPYITNMLTGHHILYPLMGEGSVDIMNGNTPGILKNKNRISSAFISLFSRPNNLHPYSYPYKVSKNNIIDSGKTDSRMGGFGLFFIEILVLSLIVFILSCKENKKAYYTYMVLLFILFCSLLILPSGWWARYVSFFYFFPCLCVLYSERYGMKFPFLKNILLVLMVCNVLVSLAVASGGALMHRMRVDYYLELLDVSQPVRMRNENPSFKYKLEERNIEVQVCDTATYKLNMFGPNVFVVESDLEFNKIQKKDFFFSIYSKVK